METHEIIFKKAETTQDFQLIIDLQAQNLFVNLSQGERLSNGFVHARHTNVLLKGMAEKLPQIIAFVDGVFAGYNLAMDETMRSAIQMLEPLYDAFDHTNFQGRPISSYKYLVGGQVCVDENFRGMGMLEQLYRVSKDKAGSEYEIFATEIASVNKRSLAAHAKRGFEVIGEYNDGLENWCIVVWDLRAKPRYR